MPAADVREAQRLIELHRLELLDTPAEECFDRITRLAAHVLDAPVALVSLVDSNRQFFKSATGLPEPWKTRRQTPLDSSFCKHVTSSGEPLVLNDARKDPLHRLNKAIENLNAIAYLGCPLLTASKNVLGTLCVIHHTPHEWTDEEISIVAELAESVMTEIELRATASRLEAALAARERVLAVVSHDLRSPLQTILTSTSLLQIDNEHTDSHGGFDAIECAAGHMNRMIGDLLDVSEIEVGKLPMQFEPVAASAIVDEVVRAVTPRATERSISLSHSLSDEPGRLPEISADRDRIVQVLNNLLENALRFTPSGGRIEIRTSSDEKEVEIAVLDTGPGIPDDELAHIFDWGWHAAKRDRGGSGLGLSIAKGIIDAHGGRVWAANRDGGGAIVAFAIPVLRGVADGRPA